MVEEEGAETEEKAGPEGSVNRGHTERLANVANSARQGGQQSIASATDALKSLRTKVAGGAADDTKGK